MTKQMSKGEVEYAIEGFIKLHAENESLVERPLVRQVDEDKFLINFSDTTDYGLFCYWVNYIVYSNKEKRYNSNVIGWYEVDADAKGVWEQFANQKLMFYVPESDTECDNVYITTEDNVCYKQEFAWQALLIQQNTVYRSSGYYSSTPKDYRNLAVIESPVIEHHGRSIQGSCERINSHTISKYWEWKPNSTSQTTKVSNSLTIIRKTKIESRAFSILVNMMQR